MGRGLQECGWGLPHFSLTILAISVTHGIRWSINSIGIQDFVNFTPTTTNQSILAQHTHTPATCAHYLSKRENCISRSLKTRGLLSLTYSIALSRGKPLE